MNFDGLWILFGHVLAIAMNKPFIISKCNPFQRITHCNCSNTVFLFNRSFVFCFFRQIPFGNHPSLVSKQYWSFIGMQRRAVDRTIVFMLFDNIFSFEVEYSESSVFTGCIDDLIFASEATDCCYITFETCLECPDGVVRFINIYNFDCIVHSHNDLIFFFL